MVSYRYIQLHNVFIILLLSNEIIIGKTETSKTQNSEISEGIEAGDKVLITEKPSNSNESASGNVASKLIFKPPFAFTPRFIPSGGNKLCQKHTLMYLNDLKKWKTWAIQMWDATGKLNSGLFSGNVNRLGDFDSCLNIIGPDGFKPNYCLAAIDVEFDEDTPVVVKDFLSKILSGSFIKSSMHEPGHFVPRFSTLGWGICVPKSCEKDALEIGLKDSLTTLNSTPGVNFYSGLPKYSCHEERDPYNTATISTILFFVFIVIICVIGTLLDVNQDVKEKNSREGTGKRLLLAFSIKRNWTDLVDDCKEEFYFLHGIRAIVAFALFVGHRTLSNAAILFTNRNSFAKPVFPISSIIRTGTRQTDTFFFMSGFLASYNSTKEITTKGKIDWKKRIFSRLIRLLPPMLAVVLYYAYVMEFTGSGPQWGTFVRANADLCKKNFWRNLLFIQNIYPMEEMCAPQTHQVATDMWLFFFAPFFVYALYINTFFGLTVIIMIILGSAASNYYISDRDHLYTYIRFGISIKDFYGHMNKMHTRLLNNSATYLTGVVLGYFIRRYRKDIQIGTKTAFIGWILCVSGILWCSLSLNHLSYPDHKLEPFSAVVYTAVSPFIMSLSMSWIILMCCLNRGGFLQKIFTSYKLLILSRLSYALYLTQFIAIYYNIGSVKATGEASLSDFIYLWEFMCILLMATVLTLLLDNPMKEIKNIIYEGKPKTS